MDEAMKPKDDLFNKISALLNRQPTDDVIPILITAAARALVIDANGDLDKLRRQYDKFCTMTAAQVTDMLTQDLDEAREATKQ
jgi:hypothetical protein